MVLAARLSTSRIYYGWYIVGLIFITNMTFGGIGNFSPPMFLKPMTQELEWSRTFYSMTISLGAMVASPMALFLGPLIDRRGARIPMLAGGVMLGAGLIILGFVHTQWQFILVRGMLVPLGIMALAQVTPTVVVANWFIRKRGRAMAVTTMGMALGSTLIGPTATFLIGALGWRQAWMVLGVAAWFLVIPPVALLMKRRPEDIGLLPDGDATGPRARQGRPSTHAEVTWTRREAMRQPTLWLLAVAYPVGIVGMGAVNAHIYPYLTDIKFTPQTAALITMSISLVSLLIKPPWGFLAERVQPRYCLMGAFLLISAGMTLLVLAGSSRTGLFVAAAVMGLGWGGCILLGGLLWANYFGRMTLGRVQSIASPIQSAFGPVGPIVAARVYDVTGSYERIFTVFIGTTLLAAFLLLLTRPPVKREQGTA